MASVIRTMERMPLWKEFDCYWLGTQIQRNYLWKVWYALKAYFIALCIIWRYDIIHFHTVPDRICLIIQLPVFLLARIGGKKIIMHIHMGNQLAGNTENKLFLWCLKRADLIVLLAKKWERMFKEWFPSIETPTTVVYNASTHVEKVDWNRKQKRIIMVGYMDDNKAPDLLLKAWDSVKDDYQDWRVSFLGNGEVERFQRMAKEMGLLDTVEFTGYVIGDKKKEYFDTASIYCLCSHHEGFPMAVLEAWEHSIAVVTTPVGGLPDVIEEGKNALTFDFGDWQGLAKQMKRLMDDEALRKTMADFAYEFVEKEFTLDNINNKFTLIYNNMLNNG